MPYTNVKALLIDATKYPAAIEAALPTGAPKISEMLVDAAGKIPAVPDFPMEIPDLPAPPTLPTPPGGTPTGARARTYTAGVTVTPMPLPAIPAAPGLPKARYLY